MDGAFWFRVCSRESNASYPGGTREHSKPVLLLVVNASGSDFFDGQSIMFGAFRVVNSILGLGLLTPQQLAACTMFGHYPIGSLIWLDVHARYPAFVGQTDVAKCGIRLM